MNALRRDGHSTTDTYHRGIQNVHCITQTHTQPVSRLSKSSYGFNSARPRLSHKTVQSYLTRFVAVASRLDEVSDDRRCRRQRLDTPLRPAAALRSWIARHLDVSNVPCLPAIS